MTPKHSKNLPSEDAIKTYRYLRIGIVVAVVLLASAILIELNKVRFECAQTSISAYYYTPVRAIFVGSLMTVGFALIVIKGRGSWEDVCLNFAGMLAPVVAVAPTTNIGTCWSLKPDPLPLLDDGTLAGWVVANIDNNFHALLWAGFAGLVVAIGLAYFLNHGFKAAIAVVERGTRWSLAVTALALAGGWWAINYWEDFHEDAHGKAALAMFVLLFGAVVGKVKELWDLGDWKRSRYFWLYSAVALLMVINGVGALFGLGGDHKVAYLEGFEIAWFAVFWIGQTIEYWDEEVKPLP